MWQEHWEQIQRRFDAFWEGQVADRPLIAAMAPKKTMPERAHLRPPKDLAEKWTDLTYRQEEMDAYSCSTYFAGDAFPNTFCNLGPGTMAACIGGGFTLAEDTVWYDTIKLVESWPDFAGFSFHPESEMWNMIIQLTDCLASRARGKYVCGVTDIGGNLDILASLRGTQDLLYDLYDYGDEVKKAIRQIDDIWVDVYHQLYDKIVAHQGGATCWMPLWYTKKWYPLQCDFSAMLSPQMFEEFVKPSLQREASVLDKSIYHLDGPGEIPHIDHILDIDGITGIQWTAGAGNANELDPQWFPLFKKIQDKGKNLVLLTIDPALLDDFMSTFSPNGVFMQAYCKTEEEADAVVKKVEKWS